MFLKPLRSTTREHWRDAFQLLIYTLLGSLLPVWGGYLLLKLLSANFLLRNFIEHGELALLSAALLPPSLYLISIDRKPPGFPYRQFFLITLFIGILFSTLVFAAVVFETVDKTHILNLNKSFLRTSTIILFLVSIIVTFVISVLDNARVSPDVQNIRGKDLKELGDKFDKTE